jgi:hypothetical protein
MPSVSSGASDLSVSDVNSSGNDTSDEGEREFTRHKSQDSFVQREKALESFRLQITEAKSKLQQASWQMYSQWQRWTQNMFNACSQIFDKHELEELELLRIIIFREWNAYTRKGRASGTATVSIDHQMSQSDFLTWFLVKANQMYLSHVVLLWWRQVTQSFVIEHSLGDGESDLHLRFPDAPWPPPPHFKFHLREAQGHKMADFGLRLREGPTSGASSRSQGSVIAVLRGPDKHLEDLRHRFEHEGLQVLGHKLGSSWHSTAAVSHASIDSHRSASHTQRRSSQAIVAKSSVSERRGSLQLTDLGEKADEEPVNRRSSRRSSTASIQQVEEDLEAKLLSIFRLAAEEALGPDVEIHRTAKGRYTVRGQEMSVIMKKDQAMVRRGASWLPAAEYFSKLTPASTPHDSPRSSLADTPRGSLQQDSLSMRRTSSFGKNPSVPDVAGRRASSSSTAGRQSLLVPPAPQRRASAETQRRASSHGLFGGSSAKAKPFA